MLPRTLKVRGHIYKVQQVDGRALQGGECLADIDHDRNVIRIYKRASPVVKIELLLHEVAHAILAEHNLKNDEEVTTALGEALTAFLWDNPAFIRHALEKLTKTG